MQGFWIKFTGGSKGYCECSDVLSVLGHLLTFASTGVEPDDPARQLIEAGHEAAAAVAELIEADKALDAIDAELPCAPEDMPDPMAYVHRRLVAVERRRAALSRIQPDGQGSV